VTDSLVVADTLIVIPEAYLFVLSTRYEVLSGLSDSKGIDFSRVRSIKHSDGLTIEAIPVGDLPVATSGEDLRLIRVIQYLFEHSRLEEAHHTGVVDDIPNDAGAIV